MLFVYQDWLNCRVNINGIDAPNIEIKYHITDANCHAKMPLGIKINANDLKFERAEDISESGIKKHVVALTWTSSSQITQINEFYIACADREQYESYANYLHKIVKLCRLVDELKTVERDEQNLMQEQSARKDHRIFGISSVKNATKFIAKKFKRILAESKALLKHPKPTMNQISLILSELFGLEQSLEQNNHCHAIDTNATQISSTALGSDAYIDSCYDYTIPNQLNQSDCRKSFDCSSNECIISMDPVGLVSFIINRAQSRSPIVFRPDLFIQKSSTQSETLYGQHDWHQVSNDSWESEDNINLIKRINSVISIESNDIDAINLKKKNLKNQKNAEITNKMPVKKLSTLKLCADIICVAPKFFNYVSII